MKHIDPNELSVPEIHGYLLGAVVPRPIAFASTVDKEGNVNLSPFSFFNCFSANPPILVFSPSRRGRDNTTKDTYNNVLSVPEVTISIVNYALVEQMSLASGEFEKDVNEFIKAGLTQVASERVQPPRVGESPISFECRVVEVKPLGEGGGAGNLVIAEVVMMHIDESVISEEGKIDPHKLDVVARLGGNYYARLIDESIFEIPKPLRFPGIGIDQLPEHMRNSKILTGNDLARLANVKVVPSPRPLPAETIDLIAGMSKEDLHGLAVRFLRDSKVEEAWACLLHEKAKR